MSATLKSVSPCDPRTVSDRVNETVEPLARRAPKVREALLSAKRRGMAYVIVDGTLIPIDRVAAERPFYSGKHRIHGVNPQVIASPDGTIL